MLMTIKCVNYLMQSGGPSYAVELGRLDGLSSSSKNVDGKLPQPTFNLNQLNSMFAAHGLSQADMVALSGKTASLLTNHNVMGVVCGGRNSLVQRLDQVIHPATNINNRALRHWMS